MHCTHCGHEAGTEARFCRDCGQPLEAPAIGDADFVTLHGHGFNDEDIWDIGAITAFFGLSNRMANLTGMRPNDEFYLMGRQPRPPKA